MRCEDARIDLVLVLELSRG